MKHIVEAMGIITRELRSDPEYYRSWQANIVMSILDAMKATGIESQNGNGMLNECSRIAAKSFLDLLMGPLPDRERIKILEGKIEIYQRNLAIMRHNLYTSRDECSQCKSTYALAGEIFNI